MKQNITIEQLNELSEKKKKKLVDWFQAKNWFPHYSGTQMMLETFDKFLSDSIGIGQMIEFLGEKGVFIIRNVSSWHGGGYQLEYIITPTELTLSAIEANMKSYKGELRDALWEAVKEVLENDKKD